MASTASPATYPDLALYIIPSHHHRIINIFAQYTEVRTTQAEKRYTMVSLSSEAIIAMVGIVVTVVSSSCVLTVRHVIRRTRRVDPNQNEHSKPQNFMSRCGNYAKRLTVNRVELRRLPPRSTLSPQTEYTEVRGSAPRDTMDTSC